MPQEQQPAKANATKVRPRRVTKKAPSKRAQAREQAPAKKKVAKATAGQAPKQQAAKKPATKKPATKKPAKQQPAKQRAPQQTAARKQAAVQQAKRPATQQGKKPKKQTPKKQVKKVTVKDKIDSLKVTKGSVPKSTTTQYDINNNSTGRYSTATTADAVLKQHDQLGKPQINYKRFIPFLLACILVLVGLGFGIYGLTHIGQAKAGWYYMCVQTETPDCKVGLVTELDGDGTPAKVKRLDTTENGRYLCPIQYGGKALLIVADDSFSFSYVSTQNENYYLCTVDAPTSTNAKKEARYEKRHHITELASGEEAISSKTSNVLAGISIYGEETSSEILATATIGTEQPVVNVKDLTYIGKELPTEENLATTDTVKFSFTASGDNLIHKRLYEQAQQRSTNGTYDFSYCYKDVADFYRAHDINWFNQESLANNKIPAQSYPTFSTPGQVVQALYDMNVRIFSIANNHTYDQGANGLAATLELYGDEMPNDICYSGLWDKNDPMQIPVYNYKGVKIAFLSYTYATNGINTPEESATRVIYTTETDLIQQQMQKANQVADVIIVGCHWGTEDSHIIIEEQKALAKNLANWGADLIIGTHPHVVQNAEWITADDGREVFCAYSLGNFLSTQSKPDQVVGLVLECNFEVTPKKDGQADVSVVEPKLLPTVTVYGSNCSNCHTVFYSDYSKEDALKHGIRNSYYYFDYEWISEMLQKYVDMNFLVLPKDAMPTTTSTSTTTKVNEQLATLPESTTAPYATLPPEDNYGEVA